MRGKHSSGNGGGAGDRGGGGRKQGETDCPRPLLLPNPSQ